MKIIVIYLAMAAIQAHFVTVDVTWDVFFVV